MTPNGFKTRGVIADSPGGPDVLRLQDATLPWPADPDAVLVRLEAASINPADSFFRQLGMYLETDAPPVLGHDGCGVVLETGSGVSAVAPGDRVCFCYGGIGGAPGTHAEHAVVPASLLVKVPPPGRRCMNDSPSVKARRCLSMAVPAVRAMSQCSLPAWPAPAWPPR